MKTITITEDEALIFVDLLQNNWQTEEEKALIDKINGLINQNYPDEKTEVIQYIRKVNDECGGFDMFNDIIEKEDVITVSKTGSTEIVIDSFGYDGVDCTEYVNDIDTSSPSYNYEDLTLEVLNQIKHLAEIIEADYYRTQKRCN